ncbi:unnamed protein product [Ilex paraguariensis]|uniref:Uncharacterized protein n=1 Tax=Ilex paraguariensis TaxID=185542 RepID=A0ABC8R694_9AQUA
MEPATSRVRSINASENKRRGVEFGSSVLEGEGKLELEGDLFGENKRFLIPLYGMAMKRSKLVQFLQESKYIERRRTDQLRSANDRSGFGRGV